MIIWFTPGKMFDVYEDYYKYSPRGGQKKGPEECARGAARSLLALFEQLWPALLIFQFLGQHFLNNFGQTPKKRIKIAADMGDGQ